MSDVAIIFGVKGISRKLMEDHWKAGIDTIIVDKGYIRRNEYYRVAVNDFQPLKYFQRKPRDGDRLSVLGLKIAKDRVENKKGHIVFAGSSQKYCDWHRMGAASKYAKSIIKELWAVTDREIIYRPKPSWVANHPDEAVEIKGTRFSGPGEKIGDVLKDAWALVTFGSNAAIDAIVAGIPVIVLGDGIAKPVAETSLARIEKPFWPKHEARLQWLCDVAYCQFNLKEFADGTAWGVLRDQLDPASGWL